MKHHVHRSPLQNLTRTSLAPFSSRFVARVSAVEHSSNSSAIAQQMLKENQTSASPCRSVAKWPKYFLAYDNRINAQLSFSVISPAVVYDFLLNTC